MLVNRVYEKYKLLALPVVAVEKSDSLLSYRFYCQLSPARLERHPEIWNTANSLFGLGFPRRHGECYGLHSSVPECDYTTSLGESKLDKLD